MNNSRLVSALQKFKVDVYSNLTSKDQMKKYLINTLGYEVWSGQKRLVCFDKENPSIVYKIAYSSQGIQDNIMEVSCTNKLRLLLKQGKISQDDYMLFGEAKLVDNDPFIISMTAAVNFIQDPDFLKWYRDNKHKTPDYNENQIFALYIASQEVLITDANRQQELLAIFFKPSDVTVFKEPKNFCLRTDMNGRKRLVLIDLGSVCPNLVRNGQYVDIKCSKCGGIKSYIPYRIYPTLTINSIITTEGEYGCSNPNCPDYVDGLKKRAVTYESKDSYVFAQYLRDNRDLIRTLYAYDGMYFIPDRRVVNKNEYLNEMRKTLRIQPPANVLDIMYRNYTYFACGTVYNIAGYNINQIHLVQPNGGILTFSRFVNEFNNAIMQAGIQPDAITNKTAALHYANIITSRDAEQTAFDMITQPDWQGFANVAINRYRMDQVNATQLYQALHS